MPEMKRSEIEKRIDILEDDIAKLDPRILKLLLKDKTTRDMDLATRKLLRCLWSLLLDHFQP